MRHLIPRRYLTTSGFGKRTAAISDFYLWFRFRPMYSYRHVILHPPAKFRCNQTVVRRVMNVTSIFSKWPPAAILDLIWVMLDQPRSAIVDLSLVLKFGLHPIHSFGVIAIFSAMHKMQTPSSDLYTLCSKKVTPKFKSL